jgi:hypothetical protein
MIGSGPCVSLGDVLRLMCTLCNPPKFKFYVVAQVQPLRMFMINSERTEFQQRSNEHVAATPVIRGDQHPSFLDYDSHIGCDHLSHEHSYEQVEAALAANPSLLVGHLHDDAKAVLANTLVSNPHIAGKYLRDLRALWGV